MKPPIEKLPLHLPPGAPDKMRRRRPARADRPSANFRAGLALALIPIAGLAIRAAAWSERDPQAHPSAVDSSQTTTSETSAGHPAPNRTLALDGSADRPPPDGESVKFPLYMRLIATFVCLIIFTVGVCGNLLVPLVVIKTKYLRNSTNLFLINLSVADLLVLIVCMPTVLIELHSRPETWLLGEAMCKLSNFVEMLAANGSIFTILAISFERYYAICKPLKAGYKCTRLRATIIICVIWLLSCILTSPILIMAKSSETIYIDGSLVNNCILETNTYWHKMYVFVSMFAFFCVPLLVLMLVYWLISRRLIRENVAMMDSNRANLIDSRYASRNIAPTPGCVVSENQVSSIFKKQPKTNHQRPLLPLYKSKQHHDKHCHRAEHLVSGLEIYRQDSRGVKRTDPVSVAQNGISSSLTSKLPAMNIASEGATSKKPLKGKTLSLDSTSGHDYDYNHHSSARTKRNGALSRTRSDTKSRWSTRTVANGRAVNYHSSIVDSAAPSTNTVITSASINSGHGTNADSSSSQQSSFFDRLFFRSLRVVTNLLSWANLSPPSADSDKAVDGFGKRATDLVHANDLKARLNHSSDTIDQDHDMTSSGMNMSSTSCCNKLTDDQDENSRTQPDLSEPKPFNIANMHSRLMQAVGIAGYGSAPRRGPECRVGERCKCITDGRAAYQDRQGVTDARTKLPTNTKGGPHSKGSLDGNNRRIKDRGDAHARSKFKWVKGISISSSTGSTYTNSTCLPSETGSASPSLHISARQQNSPSPPRLMSMTMTKKTDEIDNELGPLVGDRDRSSDKASTVVDQRKTHFDERNENHIQDSFVDPYMTESGRERVRNRRSLSPISRRTRDTCSSKSSPSPPLSIIDGCAEKPSWLDAIVFHENQTCQEVQPCSQFCNRKSSQTTESSNGDAHLFNDDTASEQKTNHSLPGDLRTSHTLEVVLDEDETTDVLAGILGEPIANVNHCDIDGKKATQENHDTLNESKLMNLSATIQATDIDDGTLLTAQLEQSNRKSVLSSHPRDTSDNPHRPTSRIDLIAMAHNLASNLHHKKAEPRTGSHPNVLQSHIVNNEQNGLHSDFIVVRDVSKKQQMDSRRQVVAMLAFVVVCFFLLFFPYRVFTIWLILSTEDQVQSLGMETYYNLTYFSRILIYLHSAINPIAYNLISTKFRRAFMSILLCRGASTRRNFNIDHRYLQEPKNPPNSNNRSGNASKSLQNYKATIVPN